ncbi:hypothetical protein KBZ10_23935 [Streptomyces sp. F63]|uniref:DUF5667 domain-containing protein n=1 Tax=Streptomyces sp. F63 TaxID=2824887 RepID=UPI001B3721E2|nr:DUF5667 domain-containing protein [Streptomyces sp. F63]MBQ0987514.1 hypothetical protein [Streptomyces sp. F63]
MIGSVSAHRRANAFAEALDEQRPEPPADDPGLGRLLALATGLGELPAPRLDPEVRTVQRARLVAAMETMFADGTAGSGSEESDAAPAPVPGQRSGAHARHRKRLGRMRPRSRWSKGLAAGGLTVGVAAGAFGGVAAASSDALPGDSLYGLKRGMEDLKRGMAEDDRETGKLYLDQASTRLREADRLMERGRAGDLDEESLGEIRRALAGMRHDAAEGHRLLSSVYERNGSLAPIEVLDSFTRAHGEGWRSLRSRLPQQLGDVRDDVTAVMEAIEREVDPLKSLLPGPPDTGDSEVRGPFGRSSGPAGPESGPRESAAPRTGPSESGTGGSEPSLSGPGSGSGPAEQWEDGLIGGTEDLLDPPETGAPSASGDGGENTPQEPDITIPPLFPGLFPDFGLDEDAAG